MDRLYKIGFSLLRVLFIRLTTAVVMFYIAVYYDVNVLAQAALLILFFNVFEMFIDFGLYETYLRNYIVKIRISHRCYSFLMLLVFSVVLSLALDIPFEEKLIIILACFFVSHNAPKQCYLKYRGLLNQLSVIVFYSNVFLISVFFLMDQFNLERLSVSVSILSQQVMMFYLMRNKIKLPNMISLENVKFVITNCFHSFYFRLVALINSRSIEVYIVMIYGQAFLSTYVAGSRLYNIITMIVYFVVNDVALKELSQRIQSNKNYKRFIFKNSILIVFIISPVFVVVGMFSDEVTDLLFKNKFDHVSNLFFIFCMLGSIQVLYSFLYQVSIITMPGKIAITINNLYFTYIVLYFFVSYLNNVNFLDLIKWFVCLQAIFFLSYSLYFYYYHYYSKSEVGLEL